MSPLRQICQYLKQVKDQYKINNNKLELSPFKHTHTNNNNTQNPRTLPEEDLYPLDTSEYLRIMSVLL